MLTRCPACATAFRLTTEQLVSRHGQVRCGSCSRVFSALENLLPEGGDTPPDAKPDASADASAYDLFKEPAAPAAESANVESAGPTLVAASVIDPPRRRFAWVSLAGSLAAALALLGQGVWFHRDAIAARYPETRGALEAVCQSFGCRIDEPADAQAISIESSDLQADPAARGLLILSAILRNRAAYAQMPPHLELALTDPQEQPLVRRVLAPTDYAPSGERIAAGAELTVRVWIDAQQVRANGYRLYAFYP